MQTASEMAHSTNRLSLIKTRARTACLIPPSLQTWRCEREANQSAVVLLYNVKETKVKSMGLFCYLGDSERIRAPCTNNAQVKFTTRKNRLRLRKNNLRGSLGRQTGNSCSKIRWIILQHLILARETVSVAYGRVLEVVSKHLKIQGQNKSQGGQI